MRTALVFVPWSILSSLASADELVVSSFQPAAVQRYEASTAVYELSYAASTLVGTLGVTMGPDGMAYVASEGTDQVLRFDPATGAYLGAFVEDDPSTVPDESGGLVAPSAVVFGPDGDLYVASFSGDSVLRYDGRTGAFDSVFVQPADGGLNGPDAGMVFGTGGDLYVPSYWNHRVKRFDGQSGAFVSDFLEPSPSGLRNPRTVLFAGDGFVYATSEGTDEVLQFDAVTGDFVAALVTDDPATTPDETGGLSGPTGMAIGPDGLLYVASIGTGEVKRYDFTTGAFVDTFVAAGSGGLALPTYLLFRPRAARVCVGAPNSVGDGARLAATGSSSVGANRFRLELSYAAPGQWGVFLQGDQGSHNPAGDGTLCLGGNVYRLTTVALDGAGRASVGLDFGAPRDPAATVLPGSVWYFQVAYRDPAGPGGSGFNFSDSLRAAFQP